MFKALFNIIINLLATVIQIAVLPINTIITNTMPDLSSKISEVISTINSVFTSISWALSLVPPQIISTLLFILTIEIAKHTIYVSTHTLIKVWNLFQKLKFW